jgi:hypothetical protein
VQNILEKMTLAFLVLRPEDSPSLVVKIVSPLNKVYLECRILRLVQLTRVLASLIGIKGYICWIIGSGRIFYFLNW